MRVNKTKGFSLSELMVSMAILTFVLLGCYTILSIGNALTLRDSMKMELQSQVRNAMLRLVRETRQANRMMISFAEGELNKISFSMPRTGVIEYYVENGMLIREYPIEHKTPQATHITKLKFFLTASLLEINIEASKDLYGQKVTYGLVEKVRLRN